MAKSQYVGSNMFSRSTLSWTWLTAKSKYIGCGIVARPMLPWTWLNAKFKCNGLRGLPSPSVLGLACSLDPHYLILLSVSKRECVFPWVCPGLGTHHLRGLAHCQAQSHMGLTSARPNVPKTWHTTKPNVT
jgi:hypothetical protein